MSCRRGTTTGPPQHGTIRRGGLWGEVLRKVKNGKFLGYYLRWYERGRRRQLASKQPTLVAARRMLVEIEARVARGLLSIPEPVLPSPTVAATVARFLIEYSRPRIKDLDKYRALARSALLRVLPLLGARPIDQVQAADINQLRDALGRR